MKNEKIQSEIERFVQSIREADRALAVPVMISHEEQSKIIVNNLLAKWRICRDEETREHLKQVLISFFLTENEFLAETSPLGKIVAG